MLSANSLPVFPNSQKNWQSWSSLLLRRSLSLALCFFEGFLRFCYQPLGIDRFASCVSACLFKILCESEQTWARGRFYSATPASLVLSFKVYIDSVSIVPSTEHPIVMVVPGYRDTFCIRWQCPGLLQTWRVGSRWLRRLHKLWIVGAFRFTVLRIFADM